VKLAPLPIPWSPALVSDGHDRHSATVQVVVNGEGEVAKVIETEAVFIHWPRFGVCRKSVNCIEYLQAEGIGRERAPFKVPKEGLSNFVLCLSQKRNFEPSHSELRRAFASVHGAVLAVPARSSSRRARSSRRQASEMEASALPSRLSSNATASADRSSAGNSRTSSSSWPTRAFMKQSLALGPGLVHGAGAPSSNKSFDADTQRHCAAQRVGERTPRGAMPLRAGQLQR